MEDHDSDLDDNFVRAPLFLNTAGRPPSVPVVKYARRRPVRIPSTTSISYPQFRRKQQCALRIGIHGFVRATGGIARVEVGVDTLTLYRHRSQSKLSQQELSDLQRATHFDKKELQQWYKGAPPARLSRSAAPSSSWAWDSLNPAF